MRCKNCGWENPENQVECEKCHSVLTDVGSVHKETAPISEQMKCTVSESINFNAPSLVSIPKTCPKCGYPISNTSTTCPNCNYELVPNSTAKQSVTCKSCGAEIVPNGKFCSSCGAPIGESVLKSHRIQRSGFGTIIGGPIMTPASKK